MADDIELLRAYAIDGSEEAFTELVRQHLGLVHHAALRHLGGDSHGCEDMVQQVFTDLARKAPSLLGRPLLASWLHTSTRYAALRFRRDERRRKAREQRMATEMTIMSDESNVPEWDRLRPVIDDALEALKPGEREAVLLRFFESRDYGEIGARLHLSQHGVRSRVERALARMQSHLTRRGIASTTAALAATLTAHATGPVPAVSAGGVSRAALDSAAGGTVNTVLSGFGTLGLMKASTLLLAGSIAANVGIAFLIADVPAAGRIRIGTPGPAPFARAEAESVRSNAVAATRTITDAEAIGLRLRDAGFSNQVVTHAVNSALDLQDRAARRAEIEAREARVRRWNPRPSDSIAAAPLEGLRPLVPAMDEDPALASRRESVLAGLNLDESGTPLDELYRGITAEKARLIRAIERDYMQVSLTEQASEPGARQLIEEEFERDVLAVLTPEEGQNWLRYSSNAAKQLQRNLANVQVSEESYARLADAAVEVERLRWTDPQGARRATIELYRNYRRELGEAPFLVVNRNIGMGSGYASIDEIYERAGLTTNARNDRFFAAYEWLLGFPAGEKAEAAARTRSILASGLQSELAAELDATPFGKQLLQNVHRSPIGPQGSDPLNVSP